MSDLSVMLTVAIVLVCIYLIWGFIGNLPEVRVLGHCSSPVDHSTKVVVSRSVQLATEALKAMAILILHFLCDGL